MHPFFRRFVLSFLAALTVFCAGMATLLVRTREIDVFMPSNIETDAEILWGPGFGQQSAAYKLRRAAWLRPELLVLGSSRVTQTRDAMAPGIRTYNAGLGASSLPEALAFLRALYAVHRPRVVVLGIDPWWFDLQQDPPQPLIRRTFDVRGWLANVAAHGLFSAPVVKRALVGIADTPDRFGGRRTVGYLAAATSSGFRPDGSYQYGDVFLGLNPQFDVLDMDYAHDFAFYTRAVRRAEDRFRYTGPVLPIHIAMLDEILRLNAEAGVGTVIFFPSFPAAVWRAIEETPSQRDYFVRIVASVSKMAGRHDVAVFDYLNLGRLGMSDVQTIDGLHADEVATGAMWLDMVRRSSVLSSLYGPAGIAALARLTATPERPWPHMLVR